MNFLIKKFSPIILTISISFLIYTFYRSEIYWDKTQRDYYLVYYLVSLMLIIFSIITFFANRKIKEYLIIIIISFVTSLYLLEGYLTFKYLQTKQKSLKSQILKEKKYKDMTGINWDKRTKFEVYKDMKKINNKIVVSIVPALFTTTKSSILPLSGVSNSETILCNEAGYYSIFKSDRYGFNNPDKEWDKREIEYVLVGDSFTQGYCVNRPNDISSSLRSISNKNVLNLGQGGNGPLLQYATLREYLNSNFKKVLWLYFENDLEDLSYEKNNIILRKYLNDLSFTQNLKFKQNIVDQLAIKKINLLAKTEIKKKRHTFKFKFMKFIKIFNVRNLILPKQVQKQPSTEELIYEFKNLLQLVKNLTYKNNSKLYFVYLPGISTFEKTNNLSNYNSIKKIVSELEIPFIDIYKTFKKEENSISFFPFEDSSHYNINGYKKVAETIFKFTKD